MKNPFAHIKVETPFNIIRSTHFHFSRHVERVSVANEYLGLCCYMGWKTNAHFERNARVIFVDNGFLVFGTERSSFRGWSSNNSFFLQRAGKLIVAGYNQVGRGSLVWILAGGAIRMNGATTNGNNMIIAKELIEIGSGTQIAWGVTICDHDFHKTYTNGVQNPETAPVRIGKNVWIGMDAKILKGVQIGDGAIVGAGAVVTRSVPPRSMVVGVPARVVKENVEFHG